MHCVTFRLGHTLSIELVTTIRNSYNIPQMTQVPLLGGHHFYLTSMYTSYVHIFIILLLLLLLLVYIYTILQLVLLIL